MRLCLARRQSLARAPILPRRNDDLLAPMMIRVVEQNPYRPSRQQQSLTVAAHNRVKPQAAFGGALGNQRKDFIVSERRLDPVRRNGSFLSYGGNVIFWLTCAQPPTTSRRATVSTTLRKVRA